MTIETELKLRLPPSKNAAFRRLMATHAAEGSQAESEHLVSIYYDTPDLALAQRDMGLRLRQVGGQWIQTLKMAEQAGAGLHQRPELEVVVAGPNLELDKINGRKVQRFLSQDINAAELMPLFTTDIKRTRWMVQDTRGNTMEVCLDHGSVHGREQALKLNEVEIELKQGETQAIFELALKLVNSLSLIPDPQSKAERGYSLYRDTPLLAPCKAQLPALHRKLSPEQALRMVVQETLRHLQANVPGILAHNDMECVHQARVALRRLRSAQKAFDSVQLDEEWDVITTKVHWLATLLGEVRDLDVFLVETLPAIEPALAGHTDFAPLKAAMIERRERCRREAHTALTSPRYGALLLHLLAWLNRPAVTAPAKPTKLDDFAHRSLNRRWRPVVRLARQWEQLNQEQRHDLRKRAKKLRYSAEFFSPLYPRKPVRRYVERLQALQQILGEMNDGVAAQALLAEFARETPALEHAVGLIAGWLAHVAQQSETKLASALKKLERTPAFW
ncbi:CHAD domain-containing protein [Crenobacter sp. SG2303]|uniref:CHAD domain-containing protein n=1 Tax=Crenobacter oryzisoli TaxID=3056844 RepID=A0ABT7XI60_9NEIS|nr:MULTISPECIES: CYTH and CHAD domain-containing protein [unclassified Crenobacter]MDN0073471.1 CHAD domain-containing protein [Crenobacter sp. SG2303]MDN0083388.1 CHAD domain-containing protein [Crenobacter sp. SG2305]